jgi:hypothetical protein
MTLKLPSLFETLQNGLYYIAPFEFIMDHLNNKTQFQTKASFCDKTVPCFLEFKSNVGRLHLKTFKEVYSTILSTGSKLFVLICFLDS